MIALIGSKSVYSVRFSEAREKTADWGIEALDRCLAFQETTGVPGSLFYPEMQGLV